MCGGGGQLGAVVVVLCCHQKGCEFEFYLGLAVVTMSKSIAPACLAVK